MSKDDFKYLSQEFDSGVLDLVKYMSSFERFKEKLSPKESFIVR